MARILVVDDNTVVRNTIRFALEEEGHEVVEAGDGAAGLLALQGGGPFDLLIADVIMPTLDGVRLVKETRAVLSSLPILAISGGGDAMPAAYGLKLTEAFGASATLYKPFAPSELIAAVVSLLAAGR